MKQVRGNNPIRDLTHLLRQTGITVAAAESCTGGLVGVLLTELPGSSAYFKGSAVTYQNEGKTHILGVREETLDEYTAVSGETAKEMAEGAQRLYESDLALSVTGYAGPDAGLQGERPGTIYIGITGVKGTRAYGERFYGNRRAVRRQAAASALRHAIQYIREAYEI